MEIRKKRNREPCPVAAVPLSDVYLRLDKETVFF